MKIKVNFLKSALLLLLFAASSSFALAQRTISGLVTDEANGETLIGAAVVVTGTTKGTLTDVDGKYSLDVPADATSLTFSFTGYASLTMPLGASNVVNAALKGGATFAEVVINAGYASIRQKESTGAITSVKAEDFNRGNVNDPMQLLQGKVAGLSISRPGGDPNGGYSIRLRGMSTIGANIEPLIVIDGVPGGSLNSVDPTDIESMDVLKDGSAAAIYGTRGSSGVILITTKKGSAGKTTVDYSGNMSSESIANSVKIMTASEYAAAGGSNLNQNTDWLSLVTRTASSQVHNLSISGGIGKSVYRAAFNYRGIQGIGLKDGYNQLNARVDLSQKALDDKLTLTFGLAATSKDATYARPEAFRYAMLFNPTAPVNENPANPQYIKYGGYYQSESFDYFNPKAIADQSTNEGSLKRILASAKAEYELMKGWKAGIMYSQNRENDIFNDYYSRNGYFRRTAGARRFTQESVNDYLSATTTYEQKYGKIGFKGLAGYDYQEFVYSNFGMQGGDILSDAYSYNRPSASLDFLKGTAGIHGTKNSHKLIAFFARAAVNIDDIYSLSATLRREGSSRFGDNNKWGLFPAISGAVNIDKLAKIKGIDQLKFRIGYGVTGALPGESYLSKSTMTPGANFLYKGVFVPAYGIARNANPDLKWEKKGEFNIGLDFAALNFDLTGALEFYNRTTTDLLYEFVVPVPPNVAEKTVANVGDMRSTGVELSLNYKVIKGKDFNWTTGGNFSTFNTKLISLSGGDYKFGNAGSLEIANVGAPGQNGATQILVKEGQPLGQIYGPVFIGIDNSIDAATGKPKGLPIYKDVNGDGKGEADKDKEVLGSGLPNFTLGWNNTFSYGAFDLNFFLRGAFGHSLVNEYRVFYENANPGEITSWNRVNTKFWDPALKKAEFSSRYVEKADFIRLDNLTLGYNIKLPAGSMFSKVRAFVSGNNLATFTSYTGVDPEIRYGDVGTSDNGTIPSRLLNPDPLAPGIDRRSTYFRTRSFTLGVNIGF